uniref:Uncharacterized protein n=1 Tax=Galaxaura rugosa TaxID=268570 RepID=A0A1G4NSV9_9FLOR|nr:Hypothetical protein ycf21 [Galaxaura rugosa]SCW21705.1 Hypothetical protein ycf21 [Galaxaura rugosa]
MTRKKIQFIKNWEYNLKKDLKNFNYLPSFIPIEWQILLTNDGSFTRNASIINNSITTIQLCKQNSIYTSRKKIKNFISYHKYQTVNRITERYVWLTQEKEKIGFAYFQYLSNRYKMSYLFHNNQPVGSSLIASETNIHRDLENVYLGYCQELESSFECIGPLWGRSYNIHVETDTLLIIHEIFSSKLPKILIT